MKDQILQAARDNNAKIIALQVPEGLKKKALDWAGHLEKSGIKVFLLADPCHGACDLRDKEAEELGCDLIIHIGHSSLGIKTRVPSVYLNYLSELDITKAVEEAAKKIKEKKIGLTTTMQHIGEIEKAKAILIKAGKDVVIASSGTRGRYPGQILGCDPGAATNLEEEVSAILHIGTGDFHPVEIAIATGKKVYIADPELNQVRVLEKEKEKFLRKRFAKIEAAKKAHKFGIIISTKVGQKRCALAEKLKKMCEEKGKEAYILAVDFIGPDKLLGFGLDAYVNTGCPRIAIDDADSYDKPMLMPSELEIVLGIREWDKYKLDTL